MKQTKIIKVPENKADQRSAYVQKSQSDFRHPEEFNDYIEQHNSMTFIYILILIILFIIVMILLFKIAI